jgi:hypothetical protein
VDVWVQAAETDGKQLETSEVVVERDTLGRVVGYVGVRF